MHEKNVPEISQKAFVRLNALQLSSNFPKVHLLLQFTNLRFVAVLGLFCLDF